MSENLVPMVIMTGMFAMIFGIAYVRSRENMAMIEKGLNPRQKDVRPTPFVNLKWGLLLIGAGLGLVLAIIVDNTMLKGNDKTPMTSIEVGGHHNMGRHRIAPVVADSTQVAGDSAVAVVPANTVSVDVDDNDDEYEEAHNIVRFRGRRSNSSIYFALIAIGGGLGLFFSYRIEKKEWLDKKM